MIAGKDLKRLVVRREDDGSISAEYDGKKIESVVAVSVMMNNDIAIATIAFPLDSVDVDTELARVFGALEVPEGLAGIPDDQLPEV